MKRFLICLAALLPFVSGYAQDFSVIARAEYSIADDGHLGNSSIYFVADGNFTENFSYSSELHLLSAYPADLYNSFFTPGCMNFLDWFDLTYDFGPVQLSAGKEVLTVGTFENLEYDFDVDYESASSLWLGDTEGCFTTMPSVYQWGARLDFPFLDVFNISAQVTSSPFAERTFKNGYCSYNMQFTANTESEEDQYWAGVAAVNFAQRGERDFFKLASAGLKFHTGSWSFILDHFNEFASSYRGGDALSVVFEPTDNIGMTVKGGYESGMFFEADNRTYASFTFNWYPIEQLRIHAIAAYDSLYDYPLFNIGVTWTISL